MAHRVPYVVNACVGDVAEAVSGWYNDIFLSSVCHYKGYLVHILNNHKQVNVANTLKDPFDKSKN